MPPSATRKTRTRRQNEPVDRSDADEVEPIATPSRKRRKVNETPKMEMSPAPVETRIESGSRLRRKTARSNGGDIKVYEDEPNFTQEEVDAIILNLSTAKYKVQARVDYANEVHEVQNPNGKEAYAKIAGNGWTFYVVDLEVRIGRPPDERQADGPGSVGPEHSLVHIDLGPSKHVSRQHAEIRYDEDTGLWNITVSGRNGIKLDETPLARGVTATLHSGSVIDIAGTQMIFVTPNGTPTIHPSIIAQIRAQQNDDNGEEDEDVHGGYQAPPPATTAREEEQRTPTRGPSSRGANHYPSSSRDFLSGQSHHKAAGSSNVVNNDGSTDLRVLSDDPGKTSPSYSRGLMLETTEDIDYSLDSAKDLKPPHSYAQLIGMAILSSDEEKLTLSKIYDWIKERYAFYRFSGGGWQNSIRHNLSLNKCFEKIARRTDEPGKGMKWQIVPTYRDDFIKKGLNQPKKALGQGSSGPSSPTNPRSSMDAEHRLENPFHHQQQRNQQKEIGKRAKVSPSSTPPLASYPPANQALTPERKSNVYGQLRGNIGPSSPSNDVGFGNSPWPYSGKKIGRLNGLTDVAVASTPGGPTMPNHDDAHEHLVTPLITRHAPKLAPPSTAHLPSQFMPLSSPAPFWKYANDFGSTPAKGSVALNHGLDISPEKKFALDPYQDEKTMIKEEKKSELDFDVKLRHVQSSSPPPAEADIGQGSPTKSLSNRGKEWSQSKQQQRSRPLSRADEQPQEQQRSFNKSTSGRLGGPTHMINAAPSQVPAATATEKKEEVVEEEEEEDDDEDGEEGGMLDLARGFQPIGTFHRNMSTSIIRGN